MTSMFWIRIIFLLSVFATAVAQTQVRVPKIWDDAALQDWETPVAALGVRPGHFTSAEYYKVPADNLRTYPVYHTDAEPPGYWEWLQKQKPQPLVDISKIKTKEDWIAAGQHAFGELDVVLKRTNDPELIGQARDPESFKGVQKSADGSVEGFRWVVTDQGVMLSTVECMDCHAGVQRDASLFSATLLTPSPAPNNAGPRQRRPDLGRNKLTSIAYSRRFLNEPLTTGVWRMFTVPWDPDERLNE